MTGGGATQDTAGEMNRRSARRNAGLLATGQAIVGAAAPISFSLGGLAGMAMLGTDKSLATAPVTGFTVGVAFGAVLAAWLTRLAGRRRGFMAGALLPAFGGAIAAYALYGNFFWLFAFGLFVVGLGNAFVQQYRFAAADAAPPAFKAQAISLVLVGGFFTAIIGPQTAIFTREALTTHFAGSFVALIPLALLGVLVLSFLRIPETGPEMGEDGRPEAARPLIEIVTQRRFFTALACGVSSYGLMSFMMTGAPLAMVDNGFSSDIATLGIQWHVMAMFAPSFVTGRLIARFGKETVVATGLVVLLACATVAHLGLGLWNFWSALILLGLGWNFGFIGATAMVASCYRQSEKNKVQGFHDVVLFSTVAISSLASGQVLNAFGWNALNLVLWPVALGCLVLLGFHVASERAAARISAANL